MIADFVRIKRELDKQASLIFKEQVESRLGFFATIPKVIQHEGHKGSYQTTDNESKEIEFQQQSTQISSSDEEIIQMTYDDVVYKFQEAAIGFAKNFKKNAYEKLNSIMTEENRVIQDPEPISPSSYIKLLASTEIDFEGSIDKPNMPTLIIHPESFQKLKSQFDNMSEVERKEHDRQEKEIMRTKYEEYLLRENNRKLVD